MSTHFNHWIFTTQEIAELRTRAYDRGNPWQSQRPFESLGGQRLSFSEERALEVSVSRELYNYFHKNIGDEEMELKYTLPSAATAYFRRFYLFESISDFDPWLVAGACCLIASKVEESPPMIDKIIEFVKRGSGSAIPEGADVQKAIISYESEVMSRLKFHLIVNHCIHSFEGIKQTFKDDTKSKFAKLILENLNKAIPRQSVLMFSPTYIVLAAIKLTNKFPAKDKVLEFYRQQDPALDERLNLISNTIKEDPGINDENQLKETLQKLHSSRNLFTFPFSEQFVQLHHTRPPKIIGTTTRDEDMFT